MAERTLADVVEQLKATRAVQEKQEEISHKTSQAIELLNNSFSQFFEHVQRKDEMDKLNNEERIRERQERSTSQPIQSADTQQQIESEGFLSKIFSGSFLGTFVGRNFGFLLRPLAGLGALLTRGGPVAVTLGLLYTTFRDIGENPLFKETLQKISDTWHLSIVPFWNKLSETFTLLFGDRETIIAELGIIGSYWVNLIDWFKEFRLDVQTLALRLIGSFTDLLSGILDTLSLVLNGEYYEALKVLLTRVPSAILDGIDAVATFMLDLIGVDFGENGTLFSSIKTNVGNMASGIGNWMLEKYTQLSNVIQNSISSSLELFQSIAPIVGSMIDYGLTKIKNDLWIVFENISTFFKNLPDMLYAGIAENLRFSLPEIKIKLPFSDREVTILDGFSVGVGSEQSISEARTNIQQRDVSRDQNISALRLETATKLRDLELELGRMLTQQRVQLSQVAPSSNSVTNNQNNNSSIMSFPSTMNPVGPM